VRPDAQTPWQPTRPVAPAHRAARRHPCVTLDCCGGKPYLVRVGWRAEQTSNAYDLVLAAAPVSVPRCGGHADHETRRIDLYLLSAVHQAEIQAAQAALAQRRAVIEARLLGKGRAAPAGAT
jgi:hypothetical protein